MKTVLISGGSGMIGTFLTKGLLAKGYDVRHLSKKKEGEKPTDIPTFSWNIEKSFLDSEALQGTDVIIHLAGASITEKKWTEEQKKKILNSRIDGAKLLFEKIEVLDKKPTVFISASGVGYYGNITQEKSLTEETPAGEDDYFLAKVCKAWEEQAFRFKELAMRCVCIRTPVVFSDKAYALDEMKKIIKFYLGAPLGSGKQFVPWIHIDDLTSMYIKAIEDAQWEGPYNAVAPEIITNKIFIKEAARILDRPVLLPNAPSSLLKFFFGEMIEMLLGGSPISSQKAIDGGFTFKHPQLREALENIWKKK